MIRRATRWIVGALGITILVAGLGFPTTTAQAADKLHLDVTLSSVTITGTKPTDKVTLKATITNTGNANAYGVQAILWRDRDPITDLSTLRKAPDTTTGWGTLLWSKSSHYTFITNSVTAFRPGKSKTITLHATLADLGFDTKGAAYAVGIRILGTPDASSHYVTIGETRTFVPMPGDEPVPVTPVVVLTAPPSKLANDLFASETLAAELQGRLNGLLAIAEGGASYLVDPALLDEVTDAADGYLVRAENGDIPGTNQGIAAAWLRRFDRLPDSAGAQTLFGNPDLSVNASEVVARAQEAQDVAKRDFNLPLVLLPPTGTATAEYTAAAIEADSRAVIANNLTSAGLVNSTSRETVVIAATSFTSGGPSTDAANGVLAKQDLLAKIVVANGQLRLITSADDLAQSEAVTKPWMRIAPLSELLQRPATAKVSYRDDPLVTLSPDRLASVDRLAQSFQLYNDAVSEAPLADQEAAAVTRLASTEWIGQDYAYNTYLSTLTGLADTRRLVENVTINVSPRVVMSSRRNEFPVTVTNKSEVSVQVKIMVATQKGAPLSIPDSEVVTVAPGVSQTVSMRSEATANGVTTVQVRAATLNGQRLTSDQPLIIETTDLGFIAWIIVIGSGALLIGLAALRIRRVAKGSPRHSVKNAYSTVAPDGADSTTSPNDSVSKAEQ